METRNMNMHEHSVLYKRVNMLGSYNSAQRW